MRQFYLCITTFFLVGCNAPIPPKISGDVLTNAVLISNKTSKSEAPFFTEDHNGNPVLTWVEKAGENTYFYYATSKDTGRTFGRPTKVLTTKGLTSHHESTPKIAFKNNGTAVVVFQKRKPTLENQYAGVLLYTELKENEKKWSTPAYLHADTSEGIGRSFFDITKLPNGEIGAIWLDGRNKYKNGSSVYFAKTNIENGFGSEIQIGEKTCQCCRTDIYVDKQENIHVAYRDIIKDSIRDVVHVFSDDLGNTFSSPAVISDDHWVINGCPHSGPVISETSKGLDFFWFTRGTGEGVFHTSQTYGKRNFKIRNLVNPHARHPQAVSLFNNEIAVVWDERFKTVDSYCNRIGLLISDSLGSQLPTYITPDSINASYPVVLKLSNGNILVSWTQIKGANSEVYYKLHLTFANSF